MLQSLYFASNGTEKIAKLLRFTYSVTTGRRDPKGIYRRFYSGQIVNVAGLDLPIDEPEVPDLIAEFETSQTAVMVADNLMKILNKEN